MDNNEIDAEVMQTGTSFSFPEEKFMFTYGNITLAVRLIFIYHVCTSMITDTKFISLFGRT